MLTLQPPAESTTESVRDLRSGRVTSAVTFLAVGAVLAALVLVGDSHADAVAPRVVLAVAALVAAGAGCLLLVSGDRPVRAGLRTLRLGPWWVAYFILAFGLASLAWTEAQPDSVVSPQVVAGAILLAAAALVLWTTGYVLGPPPIVSRWLERIARWAAPGQSWSLRTPRFALILFGIGLIGRFTQILTGRFAYLADPAAAVSSPQASSQILALLGECCRFALIVAMIDFVLRPTTRSKLTLIIIVVAELAFGLLAGMKSEFLLTMLALAMVYSIAHGRLPRKVVVGGLFGLLIIVPFNQAYRDQVRTQSSVISSSDAISLIPALVGHTLAPSNLPGFLSSTPDALAGRLRQIDSVAIIVQKTPSVVPYAGARELLTAPVYGIVPRAVWRSKPSLLSTYLFNQQYLGLPGTVYSSSAITYPGDLFRHAGFVGLAVGMFLLGIACRLVESTLYPGKDLRRVLLYLPFFVLFCNMETDAVSIIASIIQTFVVALLVTKLAFVSRDR